MQAIATFIKKVIACSPAFSFPSMVLISVLFPLACVAGQAPYPTSSVIGGVTWDGPSTIVRDASGSDNWPITWTANGNQYAAWGDGSGFAQGDPSNLRDSGLGVARIEGSPVSFTGFDRWGVTRGTLGGKSYGIIAIDGTLYMWVGPNSGFTGYTRTWLQWSTDNGTTWQSTGDFFTTSDGIGEPSWLQFQQDYAGARDTFVYAYCKDSANGSNGPWTKVNLLRVPKTEILNRSSYEFFAGMNGNNPIWDSDPANRATVFEDANGGVFRPSAMYNQPLDRYLLVVPHGNGPPGGQSLPGNRGGLGIFDAPEPWGPWTTVEYADDWLGGSTLIFANIATKQPDWLSADGKTIHMIFSGFGSVHRDSWNHIRGVFDLLPVTGDTTPPSPPMKLVVN